MIIEESSKVTVDRGAKKVEVYHLWVPPFSLLQMAPPASQFAGTVLTSATRKHAVETTEMLDFLKEIVESVPDPSAGGTIDLEAENAEAKRKRGKGKKAADGEEGAGEKRKRPRKKKTKAENEDEDAEMGAGAGMGAEDEEDEDEDEKPSGSGWKTKPGKEAWREDR